MKWTVGAKVSWWLKFIGMTTGAIIALGTVANMFGLHFDIQSALAASKQHKELEQLIRTEDDKVRADTATTLKEIKDAINNLGVRIDDALLIRRRIK